MRFSVSISVMINWCSFLWTNVNMMGLSESQSTRKAQQGECRTFTPWFQALPNLGRVAFSGLGHKWRPPPHSHHLCFSYWNDYWMVSTTRNMVCPYWHRYITETLWITTLWLCSRWFASKGHVPQNTSKCFFLPVSTLKLTMSESFWSIP